MINPKISTVSIRMMILSIHKLTIFLSGPPGSAGYPPHYPPQQKGPRGPVPPGGPNYSPVPGGPPHGGRTSPASPAAPGYNQQQSTPHPPPSPSPGASRVNNTSTPPTSAAQPTPTPPSSSSRPPQVILEAELNEINLVKTSSEN